MRIVVFVRRCRKSIRAGERPYIDAADGRAALEIVLAVYRSSRENRRIDLL